MDQDVKVNGLHIEVIWVIILENVMLFHALRTRFNGRNLKISFDKVLPKLCSS